MKTSKAPRSYRAGTVVAHILFIAQILLLIAGWQGSIASHERILADTSDVQEPHTSVHFVAYTVR